MDGESPAAVLATIPGQRAAHLLESNGRRLAEYQTGETTGALACADLNGDDQDEVIVGTETGVQVFGISPHVERTELWRSAGLGTVNALRLADLNGDGRDEILAGSKFERVHVLDSDGRTLWDVSLEGAPAQALDIGDVDGDGQAEVAVGNFIGKNGGHIFLLDNKQQAWASPAGLWISSIAIRDETPPGPLQTSKVWLQIIAGVKLLDNSNAVLLLTGEGDELWRRKFDEPVTAVGSHLGQILVGTAGGQVYRLTATGEPAGVYDLGAKVLSLETSLAATIAG